MAIANAYTEILLKKKAFQFYPNFPFSEQSVQPFSSDAITNGQLFIFIIQSDFLSVLALFLRLN